MTASELMWLAAHYHFPTTYSCRVPLSSMSSALATPGPGPATVRLALIRAGCEVFGTTFVREVLFPIIGAAQIHVRPPERVAMTQQSMHGYKPRRPEGGKPLQLVPSLLQREVAQAQGVLTVYVQIPTVVANEFRELLLAIGYWGQTDSLAMCLAVEEATPDLNECMLPLRLLEGKSPLRGFFTCVLTEFRGNGLAWEEVTATAQAGQGEPLLMDLYIWPMVLVERLSENKWLMRQPFTTTSLWLDGKQGDK